MVCLGQSDIFKTWCTQILPNASVLARLALFAGVGTGSFLVNGVFSCRTVRALILVGVSVEFTRNTLQAGGGRVVIEATNAVAVLDAGGAWGAGGVEHASLTNITTHGRVLLAICVYGTLRAN